MKNTPGIPQPTKHKYPSTLSGKGGDYDLGWRAHLRTRGRVNLYTNHPSERAPTHYNNAKGVVCVHQ